MLDAMKEQLSAFSRDDKEKKWERTWSGFVAAISGKVELCACNCLSPLFRDRFATLRVSKKCVSVDCQYPTIILNFIEQASNYSNPNLLGHSSMSDPGTAVLAVPPETEASSTMMTQSTPKRGDDRERPEGAAPLFAHAGTSPLFTGPGSG
jgi:hypothetical protein